MHLLSKSSLIAILPLTSILLASSAKAFDPRSYEKNTAVCKSVRRDTNEDVPVDLMLRYVEVNKNAERPYTLLMTHGWPADWSTWFHQIEEFQKDHHMIIPDLRGSGESTHPGNVHTSATMGDLVGDLVCILEHSGTLSQLDNQGPNVVCVGHDWGSQVCHEAARMRPDIFAGVVGIAIPYIPSAGPFAPISAFVKDFPGLTYQLYFDHMTETAVAELDNDIRRSLRATYRTVQSPPPAGFLESAENYLGAYEDIPTIPSIPFFTREQEDYLVEQYSIQGFRNTLGFYTTENRMMSWELAQSQGNFSIPVPVLSVLPDNDPVADWVVVSELLKDSEFIPQLTTKVVAGAHWVHIENAREVNKITRYWLEHLPAPGTTTQDEEL